MQNACLLTYLLTDKITYRSEESSLYISAIYPNKQPKSPFPQIPFYSSSFIQFVKLIRTERISIIIN